MEVYTLDTLYRRTQVCDVYESLIWTERFKAMGDFELRLLPTLENRTRFPLGTRLHIKQSKRVMTVETSETAADEEGKTILKLKGRSLESILESRIARGVLSDLTATPKWVLTGLPKAIAAKIYHDICVLGVLDPGDIIANVSEGSALYPIDTIAEPPDSVTYEIDPKTVYAALTAICDVYDIGFRIVRDPVSSLLYFDIYMGSDRTTQQSTLPAVVFSPGLDNLQNTTELSTISIYKNVAYVFSPVGHEIVYAPGVDPEIEGFDRQVLLVQANDINDTVPATASAKMIQRGKDELAACRQFSAFDGELNPSSLYKYETDYYLGDLVELQNSDGVTSTMQVTEQIFVSDREGERSYPTLAQNTFITPGSWLAWDYNQHWDELGALEFWEDQP